MNNILKLIPFAGLILSALGIYEAFKISHLHFTTTESCPTLAILPACYVVLISYTLMTLGWIGVLSHKIAFKHKLFWIGFTPRSYSPLQEQRVKFLDLLTVPKPQVISPNALFH